MAVDVRIISITQFLRADVSGTLMETSLILLCDLIAACKNHNVDRILIDTREATSNTSVLDVWTLARKLTPSGLSRVAVVNRPKEDVERGTFLELCATHRGYQLKAFYDFEAAVTWLSEGQPSTSSGNNLPSMPDCIELL